MSSYEQFGRLSPPPFYRHSPPTDAAPPASLSFRLGPLRAQVHQQANPGPSGSSKQPDDMYYIAKYKDMKRKLKEIELDNDRLHLKCLKVRKNIQRLRLERAILYESLSTMPVAELNASPVTSQLPGAHPYQPPDLVQCHQERHQQILFSPDGHARIHPEQSRMQSETGYRTASQYQHPPRVDPPLPPHRPYDDSPPIGYQQPGVPILGSLHPVTKPRQRKSKVDTTNEKNLPFSPNTHYEVRNGGSRTFPFVHEYSSAQEQMVSVFAPAEYPSEIRFHQYEALSERGPINRSRRDIDRDMEKGSKHKRRPPQDIQKDRQHHPGSRSCSPTEPSPHGTYGFHIQNASTSAKQESQPCLAQGDERDRDPSGMTQPVVHFDDSSQQHDGASKCFGTQESDKTCIRHEYLAEVVGEKPWESAWHLPSEQKPVYSQVDHEDCYVKEPDERDESNMKQRRMPLEVVRAGDVYSLPRVREGEVMD